MASEKFHYLEENIESDSQFSEKAELSGKVYIAKSIQLYSHLACMNGMLLTHLHVLNLGFGQKQLLVIVTLPLLPLGLQLRDAFLGVGQTLSELCDLGRSAIYAVTITYRPMRAGHTDRQKEVHFQKVC